MMRNKKAPFKKDLGKTIYIGNLNYKRDEKGIKFLFSTFGKVKHVHLMTNPVKGTSLGYAFVKMYNSEEASKAITSLNGKKVDGRTLKVSEAKEKNLPKERPSFDNSKDLFNKGPKEFSPKLKKRPKKGLQLLLSLKK